VCAIFFASGAASLIFETLWFHQAGLALGSTVTTSALVLSGFMAGLSLGGLVAWRADRVASPMRIYAALEAVIALAGLSLVYALPALGPVLAPRLAALAALPFAAGAVRLGLSFVFLLLPSTGMGATLPLLTSALTTGERRFGRVLGLLYGSNTVGAVVGVVATEIALVPVLGIRASGLVAAALGGAASLAAVAVAPQLRRDVPTAARDPARTVEVLRRVSPSLLAAFLAGFALLALEVVWLRVLSLFLNGTSLVFAMVLALVLSGIALGGFAAAGAARFVSSPRYAGLVALVAGAVTALGLRIFPRFAAMFLHGGAQGPGTVVALTAPLVLATSLASGALFTLLGAAVREQLPSDSGSAGFLVLFNTVGSALGSLSAGFVLLPRVGMERALFAMCIAYGLSAALCFAQARPPPRTLVAGAVIYAAALAAFPFGSIRTEFIRASAGKWRVSADDRIAAIREGLDATLIDVEHRVLGTTRSHQLCTNAYSMSTTAFARRRYMKLFAYWPLAVLPRVHHALVIGYGVGNTVKALTDSSDPESIDVVDVSPDILAMASVVYPDPRERPLADPRVRTHLEDGRYFLQATDRRFDLITGEPPPHHLAGVVNLYSREYFQLLRRRLTEGGVVTYWLHMRLTGEATAKSILRAFCDAFEDCSLWHGSGSDLMMVGTNGASGPVEEDVFGRQWHDDRAVPELRALGFERPEQLGALFVGDAAYLEALTRGAAPVVDDDPARLRLDPDEPSADELISGWRDEQAAGRRFEQSQLVARLWPNSLRSRSLAYFDRQGLLNDLLFERPSPGFSKTLGTLAEVLTETDLQLPALLLLDSDPDIVHALAAVGSAGQRDPEFLRHRAVGWIAARDYSAATGTLSALLTSRYAGMAKKLLGVIDYVGSRPSPLSTETPGSGTTGD
jgi:predicted membrane-bound spermidine synthase